MPCSATSCLRSLLRWRVYPWAYASGWVEVNAPAAIAKQLSEPLSSMIAGSDVSLLRILHYLRLRKPRRRSGPPLTRTSIC